MTTPTPRPADSSPALGLLGGTFDPPHLGHLILAEIAYEALGLSRVLFLPAADPPHKSITPITDVKHRLAMLKAAIAGNPHLAISDVDMTRPGPQYTVDSLAILRRQFPDSDLYFLMGGDSLREIPSWRDPSGIIAQARLAVMRRPGTVIDLSGLEASLPGATDRVVFVDAPVIGVAATALRERVRLGQSIRYQVPEAVEWYIVAHGLYRD
jgi:nicotinate-nucleotide adenylyltransferase